VVYHWDAETDLPLTRAQRLYADYLDRVLIIPAPGSATQRHWAELASLCDQIVAALEDDLDGFRLTAATYRHP
jgi:hypothetical protein